MLGVRRWGSALLVVASLAAAPGIVGELQKPGSTAVRGGTGLDASDATDAGHVFRTGGAPRPPDGASWATLNDGIEKILAAPRWRRSHFAVLAIDGETGDTLVDHGSGTSLAPASNLKILTTTTALQVLGPDFRWTTWVTTEADVVDGVVTGDVVLYGTGDPTLGPATRDRPGAFAQIADSLRRSGIRRIEGRILGDGTYFTGPTRLDAWDPRDLDNWFAAASPALGYNANVVQLRIEPGEGGAPPSVHFDPDVAGVAVVNEARTVPSRPDRRLQLLRDKPTDPIRVVGDIARGARAVYRTMTVQDPVSFAAHAFRAALEEAGIEVVGSTGTVRDRNASPLSRARIFTGKQLRTLARHRSPPLIDVISVVNLESHNLYADLVLKTLGRVVTGEGSYAAGARVVERFAVDEVGVAEGALHLLDGSGLAADNRVTAAALVATLRHTLASPFGAAFLATLPEAGTRQLRRMNRTPAARNLHAKTGTITGVSALAGFVRTADGRPVVFSIIGNDLPSAWGAKRLEDQIGAALAGWSSNAGS